MDFFTLEINNLKKFEDLLDFFAKEMLNREKTLLLIQKLEEVMDKQFYNLNLEIPDNILEDFKKAVNTLRVYNLKCVYIMNDIRELISYSTLNGKFDIDKLNSKYGFDKNYLLKIRFDLDFLAKSSLNNYNKKNIKFNFIENDPFLISLNNFSQIDKDLFKKIKKAQFIIMQDVMFIQINDNLQEENSISKLDKSHSKEVIVKNKKNKIQIDSNDQKNIKTFSNDNRYNKLEPIKSNKKEIQKDTIDAINMDDSKKIKIDYEEFKNHLDNLDKDDDNVITNENINNFDDDDEENIEDEIEKQREEIENLKKEDNLNQFEFCFFYF
jgi:hypothetical protein